MSNVSLIVTIPEENSVDEDKSDGSLTPRLPSPSSPFTRARSRSVISGSRSSLIKSTSSQFESLGLKTMPNTEHITARTILDQMPIEGFSSHTFHLDEKNGDTLTIVSYHLTKHTQLVLKTKEPAKLSKLPNKLVSSLTGKLEQQLQNYQIRIEAYRRSKKLLTSIQIKKEEIIQSILAKIEACKLEERELSKNKNPQKQEAFRNKLIELIEDARSENRIITNTFLTGEGFLNDILYNTKIVCEEYEFSQTNTVKLADQNDFSEKKVEEGGKPFIWNSDKNTDGSDEDIQAALFRISQVYDLEKNYTAQAQDYIPLPFEEPSRIARLEHAIEKRKKRIRAIADYFASSKDEERKPVEQPKKGIFKPPERDLFLVANAAKKTLYWWDRVYIQVKVLIKKIPEAIRYEIDSIKFWFRCVWCRFLFDIDEGYSNTSTYSPLIPPRKEFTQLEKELREEKILEPEQTFEQFIRNSKAKYTQVKSDTPETKTEYNNPISIGLRIFKSFGNLFRHYSEKNPITGTLAIAAYAYGASAIAAPAILVSVLDKLHLSFLGAAIQPTQNMATFLASGIDSRTIAAGFTYWKGIAGISNIDKLLIETAKEFEEDPVNIAFIFGAAIGLGYIGCKAVPVFEEELGTFPLYGEIILGIKFGAGLAEVIYDPSSNTISKILDWIFSIPILILRTLIDPIVETCRHDKKNNWILKQSQSSWLWFFAIPLAFILPRWLTTFAFTEKAFKDNTFFQFGETIFSKEGYDFLPDFFEYDCYDDYALFHPVRILGRLFTVLVNILFLLLYISSPFLKLISLILSFILPTYFTSKPFQKSIGRLWVKLKEALDAFFNIILTLFKLLVDELPGFLHIIYRGIVKLIAKTLGSLASPGLFADLLFKFSKRKWNNHIFDSEDEQLKLRWNPNYEDWRNIRNRSWFFILVTPFLFIKDLLLLASDLFCVLLRLLIVIIDFSSRAVALILSGIFEFLNILINPNQYFTIEFLGWSKKNTESITLGYLFKELGKEVINLTDGIDRFFGKIKRSFISGITRAEIESHRLLCPVSVKAIDQEIQREKENQPIRLKFQAEALEKAIIETGEEVGLVKALDYLISSSL